MTQLTTKCLSVIVHFFICLSLIACGTRDNSEPTPPPATGVTLPPAQADSFSAALQAPSALLPLLAAQRRVSFSEDDYIRQGADYILGLPSQKVGSASGNVTFGPTWTPDAGTAADLSYCMYLFDNVSGFPRERMLSYRWTTPPSEIGAAWLGVANWDIDRWEWYPCNATGMQDLPGDSLAPYTTPLDWLLTVVVVADDQVSWLRYLRLGENTVDARINVTPGQSLSPSWATANAAGSSALAGTIDNYEWDWDDDGTFEVDTGASPVSQHLLSDLGGHTVRTRVTSSYGETGTATATASVIEPWDHSLGGGEDDTIEAVAYDGDERIYAAGYTQSFGSGATEVLLLAYNTAGELLWAKAWGDTGEDAAYAMCVVDGDVYLAGLTSSYGQGGNDLLLQHWKPDGTLHNTWVWGGTGYDQALSITARGDYLYVAGVTTSYGIGALDGLLIKYNLSGGLQWSRTWGGANDELFNAVTTSYDYNTDTTQIHLTGSTGSISSVQELLYLRLDSDGTLASGQAQCTWAADTSQSGTGIGVYGQSTVFLGGTIGGGADSDLLLLARGGNQYAVRWGTTFNEVATGLHYAGINLVLNGSTTTGAGHAALIASFSNTGEFLEAQKMQVATDNDSFSSVCGFADSGVVAGGGCAKADGATWNSITEAATDAGGTWTYPAIPLGYPVDTTASPDGIVTDITTAVIDTGGGGTDALVSLHGIPLS